MMFPFSVMMQSFMAMLHTMNDGHEQPSPQDFPVERSYRKFIFNFESKENENDYEVLINAKVPMIVDVCNTHDLILPFKLSPAGYYWIDPPINFASSLVGCRDWKVERLEKSYGPFPYTSKTPVVIHAYQDVYVEYEVRRKIPTNEIRAPEPSTSRLAELPPQPTVDN